MSLLDDRQRAAVLHRDGDLAVVAGAGSGKTRVLTERIVSRVVDDGVPLESIVAITFTEKAAAEMKERLAGALAGRGIAHAAEEVERAAISTVHGFCARLLRENAVDAGVDPAFTVLDETESMECVHEALGALAVEVGREDPAAPLRFALVLGGDADERLLALYDDARASGRPFAAFLRTPDGTPGVGAARAALDAAVRALENALPGASEASAKRGRAALDRVRTLPESDDPATFAEAVHGVAAATSLAHVRAPEVKQALGSLRDALHALHAAVAEEWIAPQRADLAELLTRLGRLHDEIKGDGARLDFADLELRAVRLLQDSPDLRREVAGRRSDLLVDEYQDTNALQSRLIDLLRNDGGLFVVGDPKQSIYGFRGADVDVFLARAEDGAAERLDLARSYRARPAILAFVNALFRDGLSDGARELGVRPVAFDPLEPTRSPGPRDAPGVEVVRLDGESVTDARTHEARWIADRIVELTSGDDAVQVPAGYENDPERLRPATPGDVAVLLRATTHVKLIEHALTERDVPYTVVKGRGFYEAREVVDLANLLSCVDCAADDLCLAAVLRSPLCGLDDESLFRLTDARGGTPRKPERTLIDVTLDAAARVALLDEGPRERLDEFLEVFSSLREVRGRVPLAELVRHAIAGTHHDIIVLARPSGRQRLANLRKVEDLARAADDAGTADLSAFVRRLRTLRQQEIRETEAPVAGVGAVRILTVHQSKGLEFPIVFVPDVARERHRMSSGVVSHARDGVGLLPDLPWGPVKKEERPSAYARIIAANEAREDAESMRLLYVALTRASEHLVVSAPIASSRNAVRPWWDRLVGLLPALAEPAGDPRVCMVGDGALGPHAVASVLVHAARAPALSSGRALRSRIGAVAGALADGRAPGGTVSGAARAEAAALIAESDRRPPPVTGALYETTVSALMTFARCPEEFRRRHLLGIPESLELSFALAEDADDVRAFRPGDDDEIGVGLGARALGRAVHLALERLVPGWTSDVRHVAREALATETRGAPAAPEDVARVTRWIETFRASDLGRAVSAVPRDRVRREQSVLFRVGPTIVRGQMDLLFHDGDGWVIVDYKAGRVAADSTRGFTVQMRLYALALSRIGGRPPRTATLFALEDGTAHDIDVSAPFLDELERDLLPRFLDATRDGNYVPPSDAPCVTCAYRDGCTLRR